MVQSDEVKVGFLCHIHKMISVLLTPFFCCNSFARVFDETLHKIIIILDCVGSLSFWRIRSFQLLRRVYFDYMLCYSRVRLSGCKIRVGIVGVDSFIKSIEIFYGYRFRCPLYHLLGEVQPFHQFILPGTSVYDLFLVGFVFIRIDRIIITLFKSSVCRLFWL